MHVEEKKERYKFVTDDQLGQDKGEISILLIIYKFQGDNWWRKEEDSEITS